LDFPALPLAVVVRRRCFLSTGLFKKELALNEHWDMFVRLAELFPVVVTPEPVGIYRRPGPRSRQATSAIARHLVRALKHQKKLFDLPRARAAGKTELAKLRRRARRRVANTLSLNATNRLLQADVVAALATFARAFLICPLWTLRPRQIRLFIRTLLAGLQ
jgi:hypothetical protein